MKKLLKYITEYRKECILGPLFKLLEACFDLTVPLVMSWLIDRCISQNDAQYLNTLNPYPLRRWMRRELR